MTSENQISIPSMQSWIEENRQRIMDEYFTFLKFQSVSSEPDHHQDIHQCKDWVVNYLKNMGFEVEIWETPGHPTIFAQKKAEDANQSTLLIYNHYDVQPVDPIEEWLSPPFEPTIQDAEVYARGAQDNKGQCFYVLQSLRFLIEKTGSLPINIKLCIEGEEEMGSAGLDAILNSKSEALNCNYLAIVDTSIRKANQPAVTLGMRGIVTFDVEIQSAITDMHSGAHGGIVVNPIHALIELLGSLRDSEGKITIPGFYDDVVDLSEEQKKTITLDFDAKEYTSLMGAEPLGGEQKFSPLERAWLRPTLEINGINGGYSGSGFKTVIPAKAIAKLSCRLVPDQDPEEIGKLVEDYLKKNVPQGVKINVVIHPGHGKAVRANLSSPVVECFSKAFEEIFKKPCEYIFGGGSIPIATRLAEVSKGEVILLGLGLDTDKIHAPNEHFGLDRIEKGIMIMATAMGLLSKKGLN
ncbi:MAG: dipeptidase [Parachlamydiaceae bacterium]|nr:dipeptidase [Parachlamydiaceae bacterium]